jgi:hypothetical protein
MEFIHHQSMSSLGAQSLCNGTLLRTGRLRHKFYMLMFFILDNNLEIKQLHYLDWIIQLHNYERKKRHILILIIQKYKGFVMKFGSRHCLSAYIACTPLGAGLPTLRWPNRGLHSRTRLPNDCHSDVTSCHFSILILTEFMQIYLTQMRSSLWLLGRLADLVTIRSE